MTPTLRKRVFSSGVPCIVRQVPTHLIFVVEIGMTGESRSAWGGTYDTDSIIAYVIINRSLHTTVSCAFHNDNDLAWDVER